MANINSGNTKGIKNEVPASVLSLHTALEAYGLGERRDLTVCFPACVREYDRENHKVQVVPLVKQGVFSGEWEYIDRKPYWVSVRGIQQGGFAIDLPLYVGDTGWVIASDRDTRLLKEEEALTTTVLAKDRPVEMVDKGYRKRPWQPKLHDLESGFFLPDSWGRFDFWRFKDNPNLDIDEGLYIGHYIDTNDEEGSSGENESFGESLQDGEEYERKSTSSIIIERNGGVHLLSSEGTGEYEEDTGTGGGIYSAVSVKGEFTQHKVTDDNEGRIIYSKTDLTEGLTINDISEDSYFMLSHRDGITRIESVDGSDNSITIFMKDGGLRIESSSKITVNTRGDIRVNTDGDISVTAQKAEVTADSIDIKTGGDIALKADANISITSIGLVQIGAKDSISFVSGGDMNITSYDINIDAFENITEGGSEIEMTDSLIRYDKDDPNSVSHGYDLRMASRDIDICSKIKLKDGNIKVPGISAKVKGNFNIRGEDYLSVLKNSQISLYMPGTAGGVSCWVLTDDYQGANHWGEGGD